MADILKIYQYIRKVTNSLYEEFDGHRTLQGLQIRCMDALDKQIKHKLGNHLQALTKDDKRLNNVAIRFNNFFGGPKAFKLILPGKGKKPGVTDKDLEGDFLGLYGIKKKLDKILLVAQGPFEEYHILDNIVVLDLLEKDCIKYLFKYKEATNSNLEEKGYEDLIQAIKNSTFLVNLDSFLKELCPEKNKRFSDYKDGDLIQWRKKFFEAIIKRLNNNSKNKIEVDVEAAPPEYQYFFQAINDDFSDDIVAFTYSYTAPLLQQELNLIRTASMFIADHLTLSAKGALYHRDEKEFKEIHGIKLFEKIRKLKKDDLISKRVNTSLLKAFPLLEMARGDDVISGQILLIVSEIAKNLKLKGCNFDAKVDEEPEGELIRILYHAIDFENKLKVTPGYRQHFIHTFNVFILGYYLLHVIYDRLFVYDKKKKDKNIPDDLYKMSKMDVLRSWFLTAFWHDCSYPLIKADEFSNQLLKKMFVHPKNGIDATVEFLSRADITKLLNIDRHAIASSSILSEQYKAINKCAKVQLKIACPDSEIYDGFWRDSSLEKELNHLMYHGGDHGIMSSIILLNALLYSVEDGGYEKYMEKPINKYALDAILFHDKVFEKWQGYIESIPLHRNPIAYLLLICDMVQQWGRASEIKKDDKVHYDIQLRDIDECEDKKGDWCINLQYKADKLNSQKKDLDGHTEQIESFLKNYKAITKYQNNVIEVIVEYKVDGKEAVYIAGGVRF